MSQHITPRRGSGGQPLEGRPHEDQFLKTVIDSLPFAVGVLDRAGTVTLWNKMAERMFGWKSSEVLGGPSVIVPEDRQDEFCAFRDLAFAGKTLHVKSIRQCRDRSLLEVNMKILPVRNQRGLISAIMALCEAVEAPHVQVRRHTFPQGTVTTNSVVDAMTNLTVREREIVTLVLNGDTTKSIAQSLALSEQGVRNHLHQIYRQLRVQNRAQLTAVLLGGSGIGVSGDTNAGLSLLSKLGSIRALRDDTVADVGETPK